MRFALEPKPNEPRGDIFLPTVGHALAFISSSSGPTWWASTPRSATRQMSNLNFTHAVAQALWHDKLFHIDLNGQHGSASSTRTSVFGHGDPRARSTWSTCSRTPAGTACATSTTSAYRTEDADGVWDFGRGEHAHLPDPQGAGERVPRRPRGPGGAGARPACPSCHAELAPGETRRGGPARRGAAFEDFDADAKGARSYGHERLDQLVTELLLGVR
jgi:xylose isomerase